MNYTQDESYYMLETGGDAIVYLGFKNGADPKALINELQHSLETGESFNA